MQPKKKNSRTYMVILLLLISLSITGFCAVQLMDYHAASNASQNQFSNLADLVEQNRTTEPVQESISNSSDDTTAPAEPLPEYVALSSQNNHMVG